MTDESVATTFDRYFRIVSADSPELRKIAFGIRFEVYCSEFQYESGEAFPDRLECDAFDDQSQHHLLVHKASREAIGCVRLVLPHRDDPDALLPFERFCSHAVKGDLFDLSRLRGNHAEISRLAVLSNFRRRVYDEKRPFSITEEECSPVSGRNNFPFMPISLMLAALSAAIDCDVDHVFAMMEPRLMRLFRRFGIAFDQVGDIIDYHGFRGPFVTRRDAIRPALRHDACELMDVIRQQVVAGGDDSIVRTLG